MSIKVIDLGDKYEVKFYSKSRDKFFSLLDEVKKSFENIRYKPELKKWFCPKTMRNRFLERFHNGENVYELYDTVIDINDVKMRSKSIPVVEVFDSRPYQWVMLSHMLQRKRVIVDGDMRMGKTLPTLVAIYLLILEKKILPEKFGPPWFITTRSAKEGIINDMKKWNIKIPLAIITYDKFRKKIASEPECVPQLIVYDEAQALKNASTKQSIASRIATEQQNKKYEDNYYIFALSGTPKPNNPSDIHGVTETVCPGFLLESSSLNLMKTLAHMIYQEGDYGKFPIIDTNQGINGWKEDELIRLGKRLKGIYEVFKNEDWIVDYTPPVTIIKELPIDVRTQQGIALLMRTMKGAELYNTVRQISDGFMYKYSDIDPITLKRKRLGVEVFDTNKDIMFRMELERHEDVGRLIAYGAFTHTVEKMTEIAIDEGWEILQITGEKGFRPVNTLRTKEELIQAMDASQNKNNYIKTLEGNIYIQKLIVISQADTGCTGLEFSASPTTIFYSNTLNHANKKQASARFDSSLSSWKVKEIIEFSYLSIDKLIIEKHNLKEDLTKISDQVLIESLKNDLNRNGETLDVDS